MPKIETKYLNRAKKTELKLLYYIFSHGDSFCVENACRELDETAESVNAALAFWRCAGVIEDETDFEEKNGSEFSGDTAVTAAKAEKPSANDKKNTAAPTDITAKKPSDSYTLAEIASARSENSEFGSLINYLEKHTGHMYNAAEQGIILYLYDTLGIDCWGADHDPAHQALLSSRVPVVENLNNLGLLHGRRGYFVMLPLKIRAGSASPVRPVVLVDRKA